jgi:hypothetical protein
MNIDGDNRIKFRGTGRAINTDKKTPSNTNLLEGKSIKGE